VEATFKKKVSSVSHIVFERQENDFFPPPNWHSIASQRNLEASQKHYVEFKCVIDYSMASSIKARNLLAY